MLRTHELIGFMSPDMANEIIEFAFTEDKPTYKAVLGAVAEARRIRPVFLERQPRGQRHTTMLSTLVRPSLDLAGGMLIRSWLVKKHKSMLKDFLDALQIPNQEGVVDDLPETVGDEQLKAAVETLLARYPHEAVAVYLNAFNEMNDASWSNLKGLLESDTRLQLGG